MFQANVTTTVTKGAILQNWHFELDSLMPDGSVWKKQKLPD
jgi:hypothetical protein